MNYSDYFKSWELNHLAARAHQFGLKEKNVLIYMANKIKDGHGLSDVERIKLNESLERLGKIANFTLTCEREDCFICSKVENLYKLKLMDEGVPLEEIKNPPQEKWKLDIELWRWQKECKKIWWENNSEGIVKVITGAGKTIFALSLVSQLKQMTIYKDNYNLKVIVIVPSTTLLTQWEEEFRNKLHLEKSEVGVFYGRKKDELSEKDVMIYVINSARDVLGEQLKRANKKGRFDTFLIADECHRYASEKNSKIFEHSFTYKLGLSATPERQGDYGFENILIPNLGQVIYQYTYDQALEDRVISPYQLYRVSIEFTEDERIKYEEMTEKASKMFEGLKKKYPQLTSGNVIKKIGQLSKETEDKSLYGYTVLLNKRKSIVHEAKNRFKAVKWLFNNKINFDDKVLVFHERIEDANLIFEYLINSGYSAGVYHSQIDGDPELILDKFRRNEINILVTCKALDEGFDLPRIDTGIIVSATSSIRQRIQRIGRVLRRASGKYTSRIYTIYVKNIEDRIFSTFEMKDLKGAATEIKNFHLKF